tara:strand:+ start:155 stop:826 length:672 start_codon:yes stop_codon:yes gene_type:complete
MKTDLFLSEGVKFKKNYKPDLLSWNEMANIINTRPLMNDKRVKLLGNNKRYEWLCSKWTKDPNCFPPSLIKKLLENIMIYFVDMSRATEKINDFAKHIEDDYGKQTDAHIYVCRNLEIKHHFGVHYDFNHNLIVQCEGKTNFKVWDEVKNVDRNLKGIGINTRLEMEVKPIMDVDMESGDAIWIPKHFPHLATSLTPRLSVSFPLSEYSDTNLIREDRTWITL